MIVFIIINTFTIQYDTDDNDIFERALCLTSLFGLR